MLLYCYCFFREKASILHGTFDDGDDGTDDAPDVYWSKRLTAATVQLVFWAIVIFSVTVGFKHIVRFCCCECRDFCQFLNRCACGRAVYKRVFRQRQTEDGEEEDVTYHGVYIVQPPPDYDTALDMPRPPADVALDRDSSLPSQSTNTSIVSIENATNNQEQDPPSYVEALKYLNLTNNAGLA